MTNEYNMMWWEWVTYNFPENAECKGIFKQLSYYVNLILDFAGWLARVV